ncbi:MAG: ABC transporter permease [Planctomycetota bacterium]|nr:ABC transporter permease [Planctomycetota bacterium]
MSLLRLGWAYFSQRLILPVAALGIALGVAVLFTVLAVFQGFLEEFEGSIRNFSGDVVVEVPRLVDQTSEQYAALLEQVPDVASAQPRLNWFGLVGRRGSKALDDPRSADLSGILMLGVDQEELSIPDTSEESMLPVVMAERLAASLGLQIGDSVEIVTHRGGGGRAIPVRQTFELVDHFSTGRFDQEIDRVFVRRLDLAALCRSTPNVSAWKIMARDGVDAEELAADLRSHFAKAPGISLIDQPRVSTWHDVGGNFLRAAENQKGILGIVFGFIVLVAAYQLIATLLLTVAEKRQDIGILGALGASPLRITGFFVGLGLLISTLGCGLGLLLGWFLATHLPWVERLIGGGEPIFRQEVYKFDHIPVAIDFPAIVVLLIATLTTALLFSLLPAWSASRLRIVESLRRR